MRDTDPLFAEDGVRPAQFRVARVQARAEHALWGAVLAQALADLRGGASLNREKSQQRAQLMAEARASGLRTGPGRASALSRGSARSWAWTRRGCGWCWSSPPGRERNPPCWLNVDTLRGISCSGVSG